MNDHGTSDEPQRERASGASSSRVPPDEPYRSGAQRQTDQKQDDAIDDLAHRAAHRETILYILAVLGFVVAAVSAAVSYFQLSAMREQTADSRTAMHLEHRAWVFADSAEYIEQPSPHIRITYANHGRTPATNVRIDGGAAVTNELPMALIEEPAQVRADDGGRIANTPALRPNAPYTHDVPVVLWMPDFTENSYVVVSLRISYRDVFGVRRLTNVCYALQGKDAAKRRLTECAQHNQDVQLGE